MSYGYLFFQVSIVGVMLKVVNYFLVKLKLFTKMRKLKFYQEDFELPYKIIRKSYFLVRTFKFKKLKLEQLRDQRLFLKICIVTMFFFKIIDLIIKFFFLS